MTSSEWLGLSKATTHISLKEILPSSMEGNIMKSAWVIPLILLFLILGCSTNAGSNPVYQDLGLHDPATEAKEFAGSLSWGTYDLVISRDGSDWEVVPNRSAHGSWGLHLNAVKLLEVSPGQNCVTIEKIERLDNGDLAVNIKIRHPYYDPIYTGFDVRGIIMFPSSQYLIDPDLYKLIGKDPPHLWHYRWASYRKGDAELMNPDGYTTIWAPDDIFHGDYELEEGYPIFDYYEGQMSSGDNLGTVNGYKHYYTNANRHMFEVGKTDTRTFVIRPPSEGPIEASYAVYAHWAAPLNTPVINPATDFGPEANSPLPYEFWIEQVGPIDPDAPPEVQAESVIWHIKSWHFGLESWQPTWVDLLFENWSGLDVYMIEAFDHCPECYRMTYFRTSYGRLDDLLPSKWPVLFSLSIDNDGKRPQLATDYYIAWLDIEAYDGEW